MDKKIVVPEGMIKAVEATVWAWKTAPGTRVTTTKILEDALLWLSENPIVPTDDDILCLAREFNGPHPELVIPFIRKWAVSWQRHMFIETKSPEEPDELSSLLFDKKRETVWSDEANHFIKLAYRRGHQAGQREP